MPPRGNDIFLFFYITIFFSIQISILGLKLGLDEVKKNWALHRCNPVYMPFADDIEENFTHCIQTSVTNLSPFLLEPFNQLIGSIAGIGKTSLFSINSLRVANSNFRNLLGFNFGGIIDSIGNVGITFQKNSILVQDMIGKISAVILSIIYIIKSTISTFESTWAGPPGQTLRGLGKIGAGVSKFALCFHPSTLITTTTKTMKIEHCKPGHILSDGSIVLETMFFYNILDEPFYSFNNNNNNNILVTPCHKVYSNLRNGFVYVKDHEDAIYTDIKSEWVVTLITSNHRIQINDWEFMDWEDDDIDV